MYIFLGLESTITLRSAICHFFVVLDNMVYMGTVNNTFCVDYAASTDMTTTHWKRLELAKYSFSYFWISAIE